MKDFQQILQEINNKKVAPLYLVQGSEAYFIRQFEKAIIKNCLAPEDIAMNFVQIDLTEQTLDDFLFEATSYPFLGERKVIFVREPRFLTGQKGQVIDQMLQEKFIDYLKDPASFTVAIFFAPYEKLDRRKKLTKQLLKMCQLVDVTSPKPHEAEKYFAQYLENSGYRMEDKAWHLFMQLTAGNLSKMIHELNKISVYQAQTEVITLETVEQLVPKNLEYNVFELNRLVMAGDIQNALQFYQELLMKKEDPIKIIALLISEFRLLLQVKILQEQHSGQRQISDQLGIHWYRIKLALEKCSHFSLEQLADALESLIDVDYQIKTGQMDATTSFDFFVLSFCERTQMISN
ncbi:DNA polymerase III subunit delta [Allofustis seminis]|uniref:DNA polymerase III subunit delta n=1 Tax=Allofustis seminis TaxID=166939 RepID=UPI00037A43C1|nr:DNA polymerase III subunit delta [Allofustis seminis]